MIDGCNDFILAVTPSNTGKPDMSQNAISDARRPYPSISAVPYQHSVTGQARPLLSDAEQACLAEIGTFVQFPRGSILQRQGEAATCIYNLVSGAVKTGRVSYDGKETVAAFHFPSDLVGLAENGLYLNTATALDAVGAYRLPLTSLKALLLKDATLEMHFLCKICHELREAQRHTILLASSSARTKIILFLHLLQVQGCIENGDITHIRFPMKRLDIANYVGTTIETVSRTLQNLSSEGLLLLEDTHSVRIVDQARFEQLVKAAATA